MPYRHHRMTWTGQAEVDVVSVWDTDASAARAFAESGEFRDISLRHGPPTEPLLMLQVADPRVRRDRPQTARNGRVIQDADDGELASLYEFVDGNGQRRVIAGADMQRGATPDSRVPITSAEVACPPDEYCGGGGGGGGTGGGGSGGGTTAPTDTTFLDYWEPFFFDSGDLDIKFKV